MNSSQRLVEPETETLQRVRNPPTSERGWDQGVEDSEETK